MGIRTGIVTKWNHIITIVASKGSAGPLLYFLADLQLLDWEPRENGCINLLDGSALHIFFSDWDFVWGKLLAAWELYVTTQVQSCKDFEGPQGFSVALVRGQLGTKLGYNAHVANHASELLSQPSAVNISLVIKT